MTALVAPRVAPRLLVVEDDDGDALIVEELLIDSGEHFETDRVVSVAEALEYADKVDCALVDLALPDAIDLTAVLRLREAAPDLAIVVLTGLADRDRAVASMAAGAQDYLVKGEVDGPGLAPRAESVVCWTRPRGSHFSQARLCRVALHQLPHERRELAIADAPARSHVPGAGARDHRAVRYSQCVHHLPRRSLARMGRETDERVVEGRRSPRQVRDGR